MLIIGLFICASISINSDNGLFRASVQYGGGAELVTETFELYDHGGDIIYAKRDIPLNTFFISNTGSVFALNEHRLCFFRRDGKETALRDLVCPNGFGFSPDRSLFFASDREGIFAYALDGALVHTYGPGRLFATAEHGEHVAAVSADTLLVYDNGRLADKEPLRSPYVWEVRFSDDAKRIFVHFKDAIDVYDMKTRTWTGQR